MTDPYRAEGLIEWGSITKAATAAAFEIAVRDGVLQDDVEVRRLLPGHDAATFTPRQLIEHTSGLPRMHARVNGGGLLDPYRGLIGFHLAPSLFVSGQVADFTYSNLGYALLGRILDQVAGGWWHRVMSSVLQPASITTATLDARLLLRVTRLNWRRKPDKPWPIGITEYAPAGGIWSTFDDLRRFADWSLQDPLRRTGWQREGDAIWVNGQTRSSGCCILATAGGDRAALVHTLGMAPHTADKIALRDFRASIDMA